MDKLFGDLKGFIKTGKCVVDSFVFRLHYRFTLIVLIAFSIAVTGRQYVGDPIDCISKDDIPTELLDTYCWIHTTFSVESAWHKEVGKEIPYPGVDKYTEGEKRVYHAYYQWVCFVLFLQAILFYIPRYLWKNTENHRMQNLVMEFNSPVVTAEKGPDNKPNEKATILVNYLYENIGNHKFYTGMYVLCEGFNFLNVVGQMFLMNTFLGGEFTTYGTSVLSFTEWDYSLRYDPMIRVFPRMTKCTFHRYGSSGDVQKHDAMCLIPINILNEKIYIFLWFWFIILAVLSGLSLVYRMILWIPVARFYILHAKCRGVEPEILRIVLNRVHKDDWLVLNLLCKNMTPCNFRIIMRDFAQTLTDTKML